MDKMLCIILFITVTFYIELKNSVKDELMLLLFSAEYHLITYKVPVIFLSTWVKNMT